MPVGAPRLYTVGHGRLERFGLGDLLRDAGIELLVDVRRFPGSRHNLDSRREELQEWLPSVGVDYRWDPDLGGRRRLTVQEDADSLDPWWRVDQFRAYAAHTRTPEFVAALATVINQAKEATTAVMCSETVWWRCHRRLIADVAVLAHGCRVDHLMHDGRVTQHPLADGARLRADHQVVWDRH